MPFYDLVIIERLHLYIGSFKIVFIKLQSYTKLSTENIKAGLLQLTITKTFLKILSLNKININ